MLPAARLQLIPGAGHHLPRRAPGPVADAIVTFLGTLPGQSFLATPPRTVRA
jgi:pimeloyl-ACP methyl ester carboxylesterase